SGGSKDPPLHSMKSTITGILLFLFIPLVLFLFLRFPFGILPSFIAALVIMFGHRFVAIPFMNRNRLLRCVWCARSSRERETLIVKAGSEVDFKFCKEGSTSRARRFFDFCSRYRMIFRIGIFLPLAWYVISMFVIALSGWKFPVE